MGGDSKRDWKFILEYVQENKVQEKQPGIPPGANRFSITNRLLLNRKSFTVKMNLAIMTAILFIHIFKNITENPSCIQKDTKTKRSSPILHLHILSNQTFQLLLSFGQITPSRCKECAENLTSRYNVDNPFTSLVLCTQGVNPML